MKRLAILLGHIDGQLSSNKDIVDMHSFLSSVKGGAWDEDEIYCRVNMPLYEMCEFIHNVKEAHFDYVFFYFSGHGGYVRDTEIELNPRGERISERHLADLSSRQLNIFDCCRTHVSANYAEDSMEMIKEASEWTRRLAKNEFNNRVIEAYPQQMSLYACSEGEAAYDNGSGGIYTQYLLKAAQSSKEAVLLASQAHYNATLQMEAEAKQKGRKGQTPDYYIAKFPLRYQIPFAINPTVV